MHIRRTHIGSTCGPVVRTWWRPAPICHSTWFVNTYPSYWAYPSYWPWGAYFADTTPDVVVQPVIVPPAQTTEVYSQPAGPSTQVFPPEGEAVAASMTPVEQGEATFAAGNYDEARRLFVRALLAEPGDPRAEMDYGLALFAGGQYSAAAEAFRRALAADPSLLDQMPDVRGAYGAAGDYAKHIAALERFVGAGGDDADAWFTLGLLRFSTGDMGGAVDSLSRVLVLQPKDTVAYLLRDAAQRVEAATVPSPDGATSISGPEPPGR